MNALTADEQRALAALGAFDETKFKLYRQRVMNDMFVALDGVGAA